MHASSKITLVAVSLCVASCAAISSLGPKYQRDEVDAIYDTTAAVSKKLVDAAKSLENARGVLQRIAKGQGTVPEAKAAVEMIKAAAEELLELDKEIKTIVRKAQTLLQNAPNKYAGTMAVHLPKKVDVLKKTVNTAKQLPKQVTDIGLAAQELVKCASALVSGGACDQAALASTKISIPPALRRLAAAAPAPKHSGPKKKRPERSKKPSQSIVGGTGLTCSTPEPITKRFLAGLGEDCLRLLAEKQVRMALTEGRSVCDPGPIGGHSAFPFGWTTPDDPKLQACVEKQGEYWTTIVDHAKSLPPACKGQQLEQAIFRAFLEEVEGRCKSIVTEKVELYESFRSVSGYGGLRWGSTLKEVVFTLPDVTEIKPGWYTIGKTIAGYPVDLYYRFVKERLVRVDAIFRPSESGLVGPSFLEVARLLNRNYGEPVLSSDDEAGLPDRALGDMGFAAFISGDSALSIWNDEDTVIALHQADRLTLSYASRELAKWATELYEALRAKDL